MYGQTMNNDVTLTGGENPLLAGRYQVVRQLGTGGMGSVWLAEDRQLDNKLFAVKMLPSILVANKRAYRQLKDEALVAMKLVHPNIVQIRAFEENNGNPFLVMDYIEGQTLDDYLADKGKLTEDETVRLLKPIAAALDYAHRQGVIHRDVKPANVMIRNDGQSFILDFGIAREIQETMTRVTGKLSSGTLLYMSPEQLHGAAPQSSQDIYSFAAMAYECLKGVPPFSRGQIEYQIEHDTPENLGSQFIKCGSGVMAGLAKTPEARPATCAAVLVVGSCVPRDRANNTASTSKTRIALWLLVVLAFVALIGAGRWIWKMRKDTKTVYNGGPTGGDPVAVTQVVEKVSVKPISVASSATADSAIEREDVSVERTTILSDSSKIDVAAHGMRSQKLVVGVMTSLQGVLGDPIGLRKGPSSSKGWVAFTDLAKDYEVKSVATDVTKIDSDVKVLVVLHAKDLSDKTLFAIDQFVLRGGKLIACVDPFSIKDMIASRQQPNQRPGQMGGMDGSSTLGRLFDSWGVKFDTTKVACDFRAATKLNNGEGGIDDNPAFLSLCTNNMVRNDILITRLSNIMLPFAGAFEFDVKTGRSLVFTPVLTTSKEHSCLMDKMAISDGSVKNAIPDGHERILVARLSGTFKTAFPNAMGGCCDAGKTIVEDEGHVILCADSDFFADEFCVRMVKTPFGEIPQMINDNLMFFSNMVDQLAGRENKAGVQPVDASDRSLRNVNEAEAKATEAWQRLQTEYEDELEKTQQRLAVLQKQKGDNDRLVLSKEQQDEILRFRKVQGEIRKKQKDIVAKLHKDEAERRQDPKIGDTKTIALPGGATMEMVWCPPGSFMMGSPESEEGRFDGETQHSVTLTQGFWMGKYEVTQRQWESVMGENPSYFKSPDRPVESVSWNDCQLFIRKINDVGRVMVSLPTEAQWEYACRAGSTTSLPNGKILHVQGFNNGPALDEIAWYGGNSSVGFELSQGIDVSERKEMQYSGSKAGTHPVGRKKANDWGLYDMIGNVSEWCSDWYDKDYYAQSPSSDPQGPASCRFRVRRGGCWIVGARGCRSAARNIQLPDARAYFVGLRLVCSAGQR